MARRSLRACRALVTGASTGIGRALCLELAAAGAHVAGVARGQEQLEAAMTAAGNHGAETLAIGGDITKPHLRQQALATVLQAWGGLDLLVNNAGVSALGPFANASPDRLRQVMELNFFSAAELTRLALPHLRQGRSPMIVNVGSVLGHRAIPNCSEYCASKFALRGWSESLRAELAQAEPAIDVLHVSPSSTDTEFFQHVLQNQTNGLPTRRWSTSPERVAKLTIRAMRSGRHELIISPGGKLLVWSSRLVPGLVDWLMKRHKGA